jgi:hypothetical protein
LGGGAGASLRLLQPFTPTETYRARVGVRVELRSIHGLELRRADVSEGRVATTTVVEGFEVIEHGQTGHRRLGKELRARARTREWEKLSQALS